MIDQLELLGSWEYGDGFHVVVDYRLNDTTPWVDAGVLWGA
jgi:hypothetical protein